MKHPTLSILASTLVFAFASGGLFARGQYDLSVRVDPDHSSYTGTAILTPDRDGPIELETGELKILKVDGKSSPRMEKGLLRLKGSKGKQQTILFRYAAPAVTKEENLPEGHPAMASPFASDLAITGEDLSLTGIWYPSPKELWVYHLTADLPGSFDAVSEAESVEHDVRGGRNFFRFHFDHPVEHIHLAASSRYLIERSVSGDTEIYSYFFIKDVELGRLYRQHAIEFLNLYEKTVGPLPYKRFAIVESFLPTGESMPTFTLMGEMVVHLPFIVKTSLGHEMLHQWFGNYVYANYEKGNWSEGITTYLADHYYEELAGRGAAYRKNILMDYETYVKPGADFPVKDFRTRYDRASMSIGYGKTAMIFHMLRVRLGDERFFAALKRFIRENGNRKADWRDIRSAFEKDAGEDLTWFFKQWTEQKGLARISLEDLSVKAAGDGYELHFSLSQQGGPYRLTVPVMITGDGKDITKTVEIDDAGPKEFVVHTDFEPEKIHVDPHYDVARIQENREMTPAISRLMNADSILVVVPDDQREKYAAVSRLFPQTELRTVTPDSLSTEDLKNNTVLFLDAANRFADSFYGFKIDPQAKSGLSVRRNPWDRSHVAALLYAREAQDLESVLRRIPHYGNYSDLTFLSGENVNKDEMPSPAGITEDLPRGPVAMDHAGEKEIAEILQKRSSSRIYYVGEQHNIPSHHWVQLQTIRLLREKDPKIAIGMEMFQRPFQSVLDDYIAGKIDEEEMLRKSDYFVRWGFDYNLYRPILEFARQNKIRVIALNLDRDIIKKVSQSGIQSLSPEEMRLLPRDLDFSDVGYRNFLHEIFTKHMGADESKFEYFLQSQILWDETMASSIARYMKENPDSRMVVLTGGGHLRFRRGIPDRVEKRITLPSTLILNDDEESPGIADYLLYPDPVKWPEAPLIGAMIEEKPEGLEIIGFQRPSAGQEAGLLVHDYLLSVNDRPLKTLTDLKIALFYAKRNEKVPFIVRREGKEVRMDVVFPEQSGE